MLAAQFQRRDFIQVTDYPINARPDKTLCSQLVEQLQVLTLTVAHDRRQQHELAALRQVEHVIHHLADGLGLQWDGMVGAAGRTDPRKQQPQVVVDLGDRTHGGAGVVRGGFLFDGNGGRQALDKIDIRFFHYGQELARIGGQRFHVTALAFRVDRVECERGFT